MSTVYLVLLTLHNWVRWLVLLTGAWALLMGGLGAGRHKTEITRSDAAPFSAFMGTLHFQVLLGIALFAVMGMSHIPVFPDGTRGSFTWEHLGIGILAAIFATLANRALKAGANMKDPALIARAWRSAVLWALVAFVPLLFSIPWFRPMLRFFQ